MLILYLLAGYLIGSIPFALIIGKRFFNIDVRKYGSGNLGATNTLRILGKRAGIAVMVGDIGKGFLATSLSLLPGYDIHPIFIGLCAIVGHVFPIFAGFRGGKAIATTAGVFIFISPLMFLTGLISFFAIIFITKYVVFGSLGSGLSIFIYSLIVWDKTLIWITALIFIFLIFLHRSNIRDLLNGMEPKINDKRLKKERLF